MQCALGKEQNNSERGKTKENIGNTGKFPFLILLLVSCSNPKTEKKGRALLNLVVPQFQRDFDFFWISFKRYFFAVIIVNFNRFFFFDEL